MRANKTVLLALLLLSVVCIEKAVPRGCVEKHGDVEQGYCMVRCGQRECECCFGTKACPSCCNYGNSCLSRADYFLCCHSAAYDDGYEGGCCSETTSCFSTIKDLLSRCWPYIDKILFCHNEA